MKMDAIIITDLFKGNQVEEMRHWLDNESPYYDDQTWERHESGMMKKTCPELDMYHTFSIDKAREVFDVSNLLPTFATLNWYESEANYPIHKDADPIEFTILYNYYSESGWNMNVNGSDIVLADEEALAYHGQQTDHGRLENPGGVTVALYFNYARPENYHFALGEFSGGEPVFPSGRHYTEIKKDWC
jgi:hypothetical protein